MFCINQRKEHEMSFEAKVNLIAAIVLTIIGGYKWVVVACLVVIAVELTWGKEFYKDDRRKRNFKRNR